MSYCYEGHTSCGRVARAIDNIAMVPFMISTLANGAMLLVVGGWCLTTITSDGRIYWPLWMPAFVGYIMYSWPVTMLIWRIAAFAHNRTAGGLDE